MKRDLNMCKRALIALAVLSIVFAVTKAVAQQQGGVPDDEVLTRGPVHEAFAEAVSFDPEPGIIVVKRPPEMIEELAPDERPEGSNITWIPGYWAWDDERDDYLWLSGVWRALPPGRQWVPGYWGPSGQGYRWSSGYWADAAATETEYLPQPPATLEVGPNIAAPSSAYGWAPGCWVWHQARYAWRPGYWVLSRADWDWVPPHYVCAPRGYIYSEGYWDYSVARRGVLFAPVYFGPSISTRVNFSFAPTIVIDVALFVDQLFSRPRYHHYYFGDYYDASYHERGYYSAYSERRDHRTYDPFYARERWKHRDDREWEHRARTEFKYRRDHEDARPPRTYAVQIQRNTTNITNITNVSNVTNINSNNRQYIMAAPLEQIAKRKDNQVRFQQVAKEEKQQLAKRGREVQNNRAERQKLEMDGLGEKDEKPTGTVRGKKVKLPKSVIMAMPASRLDKNDAPPERPKASRIDSKAKSKSKGKTENPAPSRSEPTPGTTDANSEPTRKDSNPSKRDSRNQRSQENAETRKIDPRLERTPPEPLSKENKEEGKADPKREPAKPETDKPNSPSERPGREGPSGKVAPQPEKSKQEPQARASDSKRDAAKPASAPSRTKSRSKSSKSKSVAKKPDSSPGDSKIAPKENPKGDSRNDPAGAANEKPRSEPKQDSKNESNDEAKDKDKRKENGNEKKDSAKRHVG